MKSANPPIVSRKHCRVKRPWGSQEHTADLPVWMICRFQLASATKATALFQTLRQTLRTQGCLLTGLPKVPNTQSTSVSHESTQPITWEWPDARSVCSAKNCLFVQILNYFLDSFLLCVDTYFHPVSVSFFMKKMSFNFFCDAGLLGRNSLSFCWSFFDFVFWKYFCC